jgi:CheY-like chemotaxis protein
MQHQSTPEILVVDDDEGHLELVCRNLKRAGVTNTLICFSDGQSVLDYIFCRGDYAERLPNGHPLVLLDINMPGIDGLEVLRQIKNDEIKRKIPVIILTTTDDSREVDRCYDLGCSSYVTKPVDPKAFLEAVNRVGLFISIINVPGEGRKA